MFVKDLCLDPRGRGVAGVAHALVAVGSRSVAKAKDFVVQFAPDGASAQKEGICGKKIATYGSYEEVYQDPNVSVVYIGTPHPFHFDNAKAAILAGKGVLIEKPATLNASEARILVNLARERGVLFMEGVWTRFFPLTYRLQDLIHQEKIIGDIHHVLTDFGLGFYRMHPDSHRVFNPSLAGGAMLDIGPYPILWSLLTLYHHPDNERRPPSKIVASSMAHPRTGVDLFSTVTLDFESLIARATCTVNNMVPSDTPVCRVIGTKGEIVIPGPGGSRPRALIIKRHKTGEPFIAGEYEESKEEFDIQGFGLHWEADHVAELIRDGKTRSERMPPEETILVLEIMDQFRRQTGYHFPKGMERA